MSLSIIDVALFTVGILGTFWCTVFAFLVYHAERHTDMMNMAERIVAFELAHTFIRPTMMDRLMDWMQLQTYTHTPLPSVAQYNEEVTLFVDMQLCMLLGDDEHQQLVDLTVDLLRGHYRWYPRWYLCHCAEDVCAQHIWKHNLLVDMTTHLTELYTT